MTTVWSIAVDWDRDGSFDEPNDDITAYVMSARWFLGMRRPYQDTADDSMLTLVLDNSSKRFSPENPTSPLKGSLAPFRMVRIQSDNGSTVRTHWVGWIESIQPKVNKNGERTAEITAAGPMQFFKAAETGLALQENMRTDQIIAKLIKEVVIPPAMTGAWILGYQGNSRLGQTTILADTTSYSVLDDGISTLAIAGDNWVVRGGYSDASKNTFDVYRAIKDVAAAERGRFLFGRDGRALFWNRHHLLDDDDSLGTFDDTMTNLTYQYAGLDDFQNEVIVVCHPRAIGPSNELLWQLEEEVQIPAGETRTVYVKYDDGSGNRIGAKNVTVTDITFSQGNASVALDASATGAELTITASTSKDAIMTTCSVRGKKITDFNQMEASASDTNSIVNYGQRVLRLNLPAVDNFEDAKNIAQFERDRRSDPRGTLGSLSLVSHATEGGNQHVQQLARTLGQKITVSESQTAHGGDYYIIGEEHRLAAGTELFETTWYLEPAPKVFPWKIGVAGRSNLDESTRLTY